MNVSVVIISYNTRELLRDCLNSVRESTRGIDYEIFVVDNASSDGSCDMVERGFPEVHLIRNRENRGFAKANNQAIVMAQGEYVLLLNSDAVLLNNAIGLLHDFMQAHSRAAVCGPLLLNADRSVQRSIGAHVTVKSLVLGLIPRPHRDRFHRVLDDKYHPKSFDYARTTHMVADGWLTGAVLMIRKSAFSQVGLLDENYHFFMEDADWGLAVFRCGWETWFVHEAVVTHLLGRSRRALNAEEENALKVRYLRQQRYFVRKNLGLARYGVFRSVCACVHAVNLARRAIAAAVSPSQKRPLAILKLRLGWKLLLTSMERDSGERIGGQQ